MGLTRRRRRLAPSALGALLALHCTVFLSFAEVLFVDRSRVSSNADYSDAVQTLQLAVYARRVARAPLQGRVVSARRGRKPLLTRVSKACIRQRRLILAFLLRGLAA